MSKLTAATTALVMGCIASLPAMAANEPANDGRYTMSPSGDGFVRLDKETGVMDFCSRQGTEWRCAPMADSDATARAEADRKLKEIEDLKAEKKHLEEMLGLGEGAGAAPDSAPLPSPPAGPSLKVPDEKDVDQMFDYLEGMIKKFKERIKRLEDEADKGQPL